MPNAPKDDIVLFGVSYSVAKTQTAAEVLITDLSAIDDDVDVLLAASPAPEPPQVTKLSSDERVSTPPSPSFVFTPGHFGTDIKSPAVPSSYAGAAKRGASSVAASAKKQRPASKWTFTLDDGLALEGVPLVRSGVSQLFDDLEVSAPA